MAWASSVRAIVPEQPLFRTVGVAQGLPSSATQALALDRDGYLWIGTRDGLARYDGLAYRSYRFAPGDPDSLPGNYVTALFADDDNRLWVGVEGRGLSVLGEDRRRFHRLGDRDGLRLRDLDVWAIVGGEGGAVWFGTYGAGLFRVDRDQRIVQFLPGPDDALPSANVLALVRDAAGRLWVGTDQGLARWTGKGFEPVAAGQLSSRTILSLSAEPDGSLWIGTDRGLDRRLADGRVERGVWRDRLPDPIVFSMLRDRAGTRWICTRRGLVRERDGELDALAGSGAAATPIAMGLEDKEGGLWFATYSSGLRRLPAGWRHYNLLHADHEGRHLLAATPSRGGKLWLIGSGGTLARIDEARPTAGVPIALHHPLNSVIERRDGSVWLGGPRWLGRYDPVTGALRQWQGDGPGGLLSGPVAQLAETADGLLWLLSYGGGLQARDADGAVVHSLRPHDGQGLVGPDPDQLAAGPDGALWLAGPQGLQRWDEAAQRLRPIAGAPADRIFGFAFVPPDRIWLHRLEALEAYRWDGVGLTRLRSFGSDQGLPAVESGGLAIDRAGALWLTTTRGLLRFDPVAEQARMFGVRDGLPSQEFELRPPLITAQGLGLATSNAGLLLFDPASIRASRARPRLVLDAISVRRDEDQTNFAVTGDQIALLPGDRDLKVVARLLSFSDPDAHRYRFWLHDYDPDWVEVGAQGERVFPKLEPGRYRLEMRAATADGVWSEPRTLVVRVGAAWWQTPAARIGAGVLALLGLGLSSFGYRRWLRRRHLDQLRAQRQRLTEQGSEAKSRFLATLGHEIRTPMTGVLGMAELLLQGELAPKQRQQVGSIQTAGRHLLRLVNDALDLARIEAGKLALQQQPFDLHALLADVGALLEPLAAEKGLAFSLQRGPGTPRWLRGDGDRVRQILLNLGCNAIKFTERGEVALRSAPMWPQGVALEVSDTGPGLDAAQQSRLFQRFEQGQDPGAVARYGGSGLGLAICRELAEAMSGAIELESQPGRGATFRVCLPLPSTEPAEAIAVAPAARAGAGGLQLLLVEDDDLVADVLVELLASLGHRVVRTAEALAALTELATSRFDLALLDLDLPGVDGLELARMVRAQGHGLPMLAITARADGEAEPAARAAGMAGFVRKPATRAMLAEALAAIREPEPVSAG